MRDGRKTGRRTAQPAASRERESAFFLPDQYAVLVLGDQLGDLAIGDLATGNLALDIPAPSELVKVERYSVSILAFTPTNELHKFYKPARVASILRRWGCVGGVEVS